MPNYLKMLSLTPFLILIFLPYYNLTSLLVLLIIVIIYKQINIYFFRTIKYVQNTASFSLYLILSMILVDDDYYDQTNFLKQFIFLPCYLKIALIRKHIYKISFNYFIFTIPRYFKRIFFINLVHITTTNNLFVFTKNEATIRVMFNNINKKYILKHYKQKLYLLTISINYQFLEKSINNFQNIYLGIKTKQNLSKNHFFIYASSYLNNILNKFIHEKYSLMLTTWNRI